jgi:hypothetical protein
VKPLVELRCDTRGCGKLLWSLWSRPDNWSGHLDVPPCPWHHRGPMPWTKRGGFRGFHDVARRADGVVLLTVAMRMPWTELRAAVERAERTGRTVVKTVRPSGRSIVEAVPPGGPTTE